MKMGLAQGMASKARVFPGQRLNGTLEFVCVYTTADIILVELEIV